MSQNAARTTILTSCLSVNLTPALEDTPVIIEKKTLYDERLYFDLKSSNSAVSEENFELRYLFETSGTFFCIVAHSQAVDNESAYTSLMVLKVVDRNHLQTISDQAFAQIKNACDSVVAKNQKVKIGDAVEVFGDFEEP